MLMRRQGVAFPYNGYTQIIVGQTELFWACCTGNANLLTKWGECIATYAERYSEHNIMAENSPIYKVMEPLLAHLTWWRKEQEALIELAHPALAFEPEPSERTARLHNKAREERKTALANLNAEHVKRAHDMVSMLKNAMLIAGNTPGLKSLHWATGYGENEWWNELIAIAAPLSAAIKAPIKKRKYE